MFESVAVFLRSEHPKSMIASELQVFLRGWNGVAEDVLQSLKGLENASGMESSAVLVQLDEALRKIEMLEQRMTSATFFLPAYDLRRCTEKVNGLKELYWELRVLHFPRQRFRFRKLDFVVEESEADGAHSDESLTPVGLPSSESADGNVLRIESRRGEVIRIDVKGADVVVRDVERCTVHITGVSGAVRVMDASASKMTFEAVTGALHVTNCRDMEFTAASRQLRVHDSEGCCFNALVSTGPIIEGSSGLLFREYTPRSTEAKALLSSAKLDPEQNEWNMVKDFSWLKVHNSPNWTTVVVE